MTLADVLTFTATLGILAATAYAGHWYEAHWPAWRAKWWDASK